VHILKDKSCHVSFNSLVTSFSVMMFHVASIMYNTENRELPRSMRLFETAVSQALLRWGKELCGESTEFIASVILTSNIVIRRVAP